jgi:hypothetical protein
MDRKGMIIGTILGVVISSSIVWADSVWHQKIRVEVTIPRKIEITFNTLRLTFGEVEDIATKQLEITNNNDFPVDLLWEEYNVPDGLNTSLWLNDKEVLQNFTIIQLEPLETKILYYEVENVGAKAQAGSSITYEWTIKFFMTK